MIRNLTGAYVIIGTNAPRAVILSMSELALFRDRERVSGIDKAVSYTFGKGAAYALPCTSDCMEFIALNYVGTQQDAVRQICARIALGQPIGDGKDLTEGGGQGARVDAPVPRPTRPSNALTLESLTASLG